MKALKTDKTPLGTSKQDVTPLQESVKRNQSQLQSSTKGKTPTPLQLLVKEMPGETVPHFQIYIPPYMHFQCIFIYSS